MLVWRFTYDELFDRADYLVKQNAELRQRNRELQVEISKLKLQLINESRTKAATQEYMDRRREILDDPSKVVRQKRETHSSKTEDVGGTTVVPVFIESMTQRSPEPETVREKVSSKSVQPEQTEEFVTGGSFGGEKPEFVTGGRMEDSKPTESTSSTSSYESKSAEKDTSFSSSHESSSSSSYSSGSSSSYDSSSSSSDSSSSSGSY